LFFALDWQTAPTKMIAGTSLDMAIFLMGEKVAMIFGLLRKWQQNAHGGRRVNC
jgi:hypothetical protein